MNEETDRFHVLLEDLNLRIGVFADAQLATTERMYRLETRCEELENRVDLVAMTLKIQGAKLDRLEAPQPARTTTRTRRKR